MKTTYRQRSQKPFGLDAVSIMAVLIIAAGYLGYNWASTYAQVGGVVDVSFPTAGDTLYWGNHYVIEFGTTGIVGDMDIILVGGPNGDWEQTIADDVYIPQDAGYSVAWELTYDDGYCGFGVSGPVHLKFYSGDGSILYGASESFTIDSLVEFVAPPDGTCAWPGVIPELNYPSGQILPVEVRVTPFNSVEWERDTGMSAVGTGLFKQDTGAFGADGSLATHEWIPITTDINDLTFSADGSLVTYNWHLPATSQSYAARLAFVVNPGSTGVPTPDTAQYFALTHPFNVLSPSTVSGSYISGSLPIVPAGSEEIVTALNQFGADYNANGAVVGFSIQFLNGTAQAITVPGETLVPGLDPGLGNFYPVTVDGEGDYPISRFAGAWLDEVASIKVRVYMETLNYAAMQPYVASIGIAYTLGSGQEPPAETALITLKLTLPLEGNLYDYDVEDRVSVVVIGQGYSQPVVDSAYPITLGDGADPVVVVPDVELGLGYPYDVWAKGKYHLAVANQFTVPTNAADGDDINITLKQSLIGDLIDLVGSFNFINAQDWQRFLLDYLTGGVADLNGDGEVNSQDYVRYFQPNYLEMGDLRPGT